MNFVKNSSKNSRFCKKSDFLHFYFLSFESNFEAANKRKKERYTSLAADIEDKNYTCNNFPFEIGSRGYISLSNKSTLTLLHHLCQPRTKLRNFIQNISKVSIWASYSIYLSRNESNWTSVDLLKPRLWIFIQPYSYVISTFMYAMWERVWSYVWKAGLCEIGKQIFVSL